MPKHITIAIPHDLGAAEVIRRLDQRTDWAVQRLKRENISVTMTEWVEDRRAFTARALGQDVRGNIVVAGDTLLLEAKMPWTIGVFAPAIEAAAKHYGARLLATAEAA
ncbi:polyhydroxyalkanoic acid system family protein [Methylobacterium sp. CM6246]